MPVTLPTFGRRRLSAGRPSARAAGNSVVTTDVRGETAAYPGAGGGRNNPPRDGADVRTPPSLLNERVYAAVTQNNRLVARDRHIVSRRGRTVTSRAHQAPYGGTPNPEADGPAPPAYEQVNRTNSWQVGTSSTANFDNDGEHASTTAGRRRFPLSNQGSTPWERVYGGTRGLVRPYGARGFVEGPAPRTYALPGGPVASGTLLTVGDKLDGPQLVSGGLPHGLHSPTISDRLLAGKRLAATKASRRPAAQGRMQRPASSKVAGQSYSQTVVGQDGRGGGVLPRRSGGRVPGVNTRFTGR